MEKYILQLDKYGHFEVGRNLKGKGKHSQEKKMSDAGLPVGRTEVLSIGIVAAAGSLKGQVLSSDIHRTRTGPHT